ncbi:MAG: sigma-70 family RNA polymerase sigma factor [Myxococcota bacterium]
MCVREPISPAAQLPVDDRETRFRRLYAAHFGFVWGVVRSHPVAPRHREDLVQEVWVKAYRNMELLRPDASARAWLAALARRCVQHYRRREFRTARKEQAVVECRDEATDPHLRFERWQLADAVLQHLSEDQRAAYVMVYAYGATGPEVASALGVSANTVYSRLRLAQRKVDRWSHVYGVVPSSVAEDLRDDPESRRAQARVFALVALEIRIADAPAVPAAGATGLQVAVAVAVLGLAAALGFGATARANATSRGDGGTGPRPASVVVDADRVSSDDERVPGAPTPAVSPSSGSEGPQGPLVPKPPEVPRPRSGAERRAPVGTSNATIAPDGSGPGAPAAGPARAQAPRATRSPGASVPSPELERGVGGAPVPAPTDRAFRDGRRSSLARASEGPAAAAPTARRVAERPSAARPPVAVRAPAVANHTDGGREPPALRAGSRNGWGADARARDAAAPVSLRGETELLAEAKAALNRGRAKEALSLLSRYGRRFRKGAMKDVAMRLRIEALCLRGQDRQARRVSQTAARRNVGGAVSNPEAPCR